MGDTQAGTIIAGKYELEARIGRGATGAVWRARHLALDRAARVHAPLARERREVTVLFVDVAAFTPPRRACAARSSRRRSAT